MKRIGTYLILFVLCSCTPPIDGETFTIDFSANKNQINFGEEVTLKWNVKGFVKGLDSYKATGCALRYRPVESSTASIPEAVDCTGETKVFPTSSIRYQLSATYNLTDTPEDEVIEITLLANTKPPIEVPNPQFLNLTANTDSVVGSFSFQNDSSENLNFTIRSSANWLSTNLSSGILGASQTQSVDVTADCSIAQIGAPTQTDFNSSVVIEELKGFSRSVTVSLTCDKGVTLLQVPIVSSEDDTEEEEFTSTLYPQSIDLDLGAEGSMGPKKTVGLRFQNVQIPADSGVRKAWIQFTVDNEQASVGSPSINVSLVDQVNAGPLSDFTSLPKIGTITWNPQPWLTFVAQGEAQQVDVTSLLRLMTSKPGWNSGNAIAFVLENTSSGVRIAESYDGNPRRAPILFVELGSSSEDLPPIANDDSYSVARDEVLSRTVAQGLLSNDSDPESQALTVTLVNDVSEGALELNPDGSFTYDALGVLADSVTFTYQATDPQSNSDVASVIISITDVGVNTVEKLIVDGMDDAEEEPFGSSPGLTYNMSGDLDFGSEATPAGVEKIVGLRFSDITIPKDATISSAYIQFTANDDDLGEDSAIRPSTIQVNLVDDPNPSTFSTETFTLSNLLLVSDPVVIWQPPAWTTFKEQGPNQRVTLTELVQFAVNRSDWTEGNALAFVYRQVEDGIRIAMSVEGANEAVNSNPSLAPTLIIRYTLSP